MKMQVLGLSDHQSLLMVISLSMRIVPVQVIFKLDTAQGKIGLIA